MQEQLNQTKEKFNDCVVRTNKVIEKWIKLHGTIAAKIRDAKDVRAIQTFYDKYQSENNGPTKGFIININSLSNDKINYLGSSTLSSLGIKNSITLVADLKNKVWFQE
jgi:excinuclease UvrABC helicase subunit UvrB